MLVKFLNLGYRIKGGVAVVEGEIKDRPGVTPVPVARFNGQRQPEQPFPHRLHRNPGNDFRAEVGFEFSERFPEALRVPFTYLVLREAAGELLPYPFGQVGKGDGISRFL